MREAQTHCTVCGRLFAHASAYLWAVEPIGAVAVSILACEGCQRDPNWRERLRTTLEQRYGTERIYGDPGVAGL